MASPPSAPSPGSPGPWRLVLGAGMLFGCLPLVQGLQVVEAWWSERAGRTTTEQLATYGRAWNAPELDALAAELDRVLPEDAPLLMTPAGGPDRSGRTRYHLFLADRLHPRPVYVRQPAWASGTLVDYGSWLDYHFELLDTDGSGLPPEAERRRANKRKRTAADLRERGVEWELLFDLDLQQPMGDLRLLHRGEPVELDLAAVRAAGEARE